MTRARVQAPQVVVGADGAPLPAGTAAAVGRLDGVDARHRGGDDRGPSARRGPRRPEPLGRRRPGGDGGRRARSTRRRRRVARATSAATPSPSAACSRTPATSGWATPGGPDGRHRPRRRSASPPIYDRAAGLGGRGARPARRATPRRAIRPTPRCSSPAAPAAGRVTRALRLRPSRACEPLSRGEYLDTVHASNVDGAWGVWLVVGLATAFAALALDQHRGDDHDRAPRRARDASACSAPRRGHAIRMVDTRDAPDRIAIALAAGAAIVAVAVAGVPARPDRLPARRAARAGRRARRRRGGPRPARRRRHHATRAPRRARRGDARQRVSAGSPRRPPRGLPCRRRAHFRTTTRLLAPPHCRAPAGTLRSPTIRSPHETSSR